MQPFYLIVIDEDAKTFAIHGPMLNDEGFNEAVCAAQDAGRNVRCLSTAMHSREFISKYWADEGLTEVPEIVLPEVPVS